MLSPIRHLELRHRTGGTTAWCAVMATATAFAFSACAPAIPLSGNGGSPQTPMDSGATGGTVGDGSGGAGTGGAIGSGGAGSGGSLDAGSGTGGRGTGGAGTGVDAGRDIGGGVGGAAGAGFISAVCPTSALVCEDFEDGTANGWSPLASGMTISTAHAASGTNSLAINIPANGRGGMITFKGAPLFPLVNKTMWGRVMVWFDSISAGHTDIVRGQAASGGNPSYNVGEQRGAYLLNYYNGSSATDCWARPRAPTPTVVALNKWMCWEWSFDAGNNDMQFFVDGALYRHVAMTGDGCLTGNGAWIAPPDFGTVGIGANIAEIQPTVMQMWFDDIAVGTSGRIGCPAP